MSQTGTGKEKEKKNIGAVIIGFLAFATALLAFLAAYFDFQSKRPPDQPSPTLTQTLIATILAEPGISPSTPTPEGMLYTVRFVGHFVSGSHLPRNVYYYADNGSRQLLASIGDSIDKTFQVKFARSIRVHVELEAGTIWREELYVNDSLVASGEVDNNGLSYSAP